MDSTLPLHSLHSILSCCRCLGGDAGACVEGLLQQLRPHQPQHQSWRHHHGTDRSDDRKQNMMFLNSVLVDVAIQYIDSYDSYDFIQFNKVMIQ